MIKYCTKSSVSVIWLGLLIGVAVVAQGNPPPRLSAVLPELKHNAAKLPLYLQIKILPAIALVEAQSGQASVAQKTFEQALTLVVRHKEEKVGWFSDFLVIAEHQHKAKQEEAAETTIATALELARVIGTESAFIIYLRLVAVTQARLGDFEGVERTLARLYELFGSHMSSVEVAAMQDVAEALMRQGDHQAAKAIVHAFVSRKKNWETREAAVQTRELAVLFAKLGEVERTEQILEKVWQVQKGIQANGPEFNLLINAETMLKVATGFWEAGQDAAARSTLRKVLRAIEKMKAQASWKNFDQALEDYVWPKVAVLQAKLGNLQVAQRMLPQISIEEMKVEPLHAILETQLQRGDIEKARQTAQHPAIRGSDGVIEAQVRYGDVEGAKRSMEALKKAMASNKDLQRYRRKYQINEQPPDYRNAVRTVAKARTKNREYHETLEWARTQPTLDLRTYALLGAAEGLVPSPAEK